MCPAFGVSQKLACRTRNVHRLGFAFLLSVHGWKLCPFARNGLLGLTKTGVHSLGYSLVHEGEWSRKLQYESDHFFHISEDALSFYTLRLLRMIREALMYLVYAVEISENKKEKTGKAVPMYLSEYPDSSKL